ncbi:hypothetical protein GH714_000646 [Hevea brasiliensis]|uniref:Uncharacterized protein n=1 Tax=Hevea brasiliensis TaxID=3981 RepID=A0A6A6LMJ4_HEVBR|nr:hypothetical protein GH714_000646 [Hevea brasiliensis]
MVALNPLSLAPYLHLYSFVIVKSVCGMPMAAIIVFVSVTVSVCVKVKDDPLDFQVPSHLAMKLHRSEYHQLSPRSKLISSCLAQAVAAITHSRSVRSSLSPHEYAQGSITSFSSDTALLILGDDEDSAAQKAEEYKDNTTVKAKETTDAAARKMEEEKESVKGKAEYIKESAKGKMGEYADKAKETKGLAKEKLGEYKDYAAEKAQETKESAEG